MICLITQPEVRALTIRIRTGILEMMQLCGFELSKIFNSIAKVSASHFFTAPISYAMDLESELTVDIIPVLVKG